MISEKELLEKIEQVSTKFTGQIDDLQAAVGMVTIGRLYGWRVMRLACSRRHWTITCKLFGDLKEILPERGVLAHKSVGLKIVDRAHDYWEVVKGHEVVVSQDRKMLL